MLAFLSMAWLIVFVKYVSVVFSGNHFHENSGFKLFGSASSNGISNDEHKIWQPAVKRLFVDRVQTQIITKVLKYRLNFTHCKSVE